MYQLCKDMGYERSIVGMLQFTAGKFSYGIELYYAEVIGLFMLTLGCLRRHIRWFTSGCLFLMLSSLLFQYPCYLWQWNLWFCVLAAPLVFYEYSHNYMQ